MALPPPPAPRLGLSEELAARAAAATLGEIFRDQVRLTPHAPATECGARRLTYAELNGRVNRLCAVFRRLGLVRGDRAAILSENRTEYLECALAAAKSGVILCCQNWRLAAPELAHCIALTEPAAVFVSPRHAPALSEVPHGVPAVVAFGQDYEDRLAAESEDEPEIAVHPEDGLLILYTSGTTGLPKGALIGHRAELARLQVSRIDGGLAPGDGFVAWAPMFHMVSTEHALHVLCLGGKVTIVDGADIDLLLEAVAAERQWWLVLMPGMLDQFLAALRRRGVQPTGIKVCGALADLVSTQQIAETSHLLQAPYWNTFGSTETGMLPCAGGRFPVGEAPGRLSKLHNSLYRWRLVDAEGRDVQPGTPGEIAVRGPTLFSGYWNAPETNAREFRDGWFHMGDMFRENPDGSIDFVDRAKYLIKSGGENVYPVEIERVLLADPRVADCVVVRRADPRWGEVPVAFVAPSNPGLTADDLLAVCRAELAGYKRPKEIRFVASPDDFPRSTTGKILRREVEKWLQESS